MYLLLLINRSRLSFTLCSIVPLNSISIITMHKLRFNSTSTNQDRLISQSLQSSPETFKHPPKTRAPLKWNITRSHSSVIPETLFAVWLSCEPRIAISRRHCREITVERIEEISSRNDRSPLNKSVHGIPCRVERKAGRENKRVRGGRSGLKQPPKETPGSPRRREWIMPPPGPPFATIISQRRALRLENSRPLLSRRLSDPGIARPRDFCSIRQRAESFSGNFAGEITFLRNDSGKSFRVR